VCVHVLTHMAQVVGANLAVEDGVQSKFGSGNVIGIERREDI